jgi:hypothetical protein
MFGNDLGIETILSFRLLPVVDDFLTFVDSIPRVAMIPY